MGHPVIRNALTIVFIGEGMVLASAIEQAQARGHSVTGVFATSVSESRVWAQAGLPVAQSVEAPGDFIARCRAFDVLISANNRHVLDEKALSAPAFAAINYHNAPLPAYAGLRATAWAVARGEAEHGITWHRLEVGVDTGNILIQRRFRLDHGETTASLNARCTAAALECLPDLFEQLESGDLAGELQDLQRRSYFSRRDTVPNGGLIDWRWTRKRLIQLVCACDWGPTPNDFGSVAIVVGDGSAAFVRSAAFAEGRGALGEVIRAVNDQVTVVCEGGAVQLTMCEAGLLRDGMQLPVLADAALRAAADQQRTAMLNEAHWLPALRWLALQPPRPSSAPCSGSTVMVAGNGQFLSAVSRVLGAQAVVAVQCPAAHPLLDDWRPIQAGRGADSARSPPLRDVLLRHPDLASLSSWPARVSVRLVRDVTHLESGTLVFDASNRLHHRDASGLAAAVAAAINESEAVSAEIAVADRPTLMDTLTSLAAANPLAPAFEDGVRTVTRGEFLELATQWARRLQAAGLVEEGGVGILLPAGVDFAVATLGSMLSHGAYVPLNLKSPVKRRQTEIVEAGITHLITRRSLAATVPGVDVVVLYIDDVAQPLAAEALGPISASAVAYRIFTSESTGRPKAVEVEHGALENLVRHYLTALKMGAEDRMPMLAHPTFDAAVADVWPVLAAGGTVLIPPDNLLLDPVGLIDWLHMERVTCAFVPTAIGERLLQLPWPPDVSLRHLLIGGDALYGRPPIGLRFNVVNTYGPTEDTVDSLWATLAPGTSRPPIGTPIPGVKAWMIPIEGDGSGRSDEGELVLAGAQVARGYHGQPELTADRFLTSPAGVCCYRTGDRVRINRDGEYEFLGRIDQQVQLRGIRTEPGELEAILRMGGQVREAVCVPEYTAAVATGLIAHVVPADGVNSDGLAEELLRWLADHIAPAVMPRQVIVHAALPRTAAGKIDRQMLATPSASPGLSAPDEIDLLGELWRRSLPGNVADSNGNFWNLGGNSLGAMHLLLEIHRLMNLRIPIAQFFLDPTLSGLRRTLAAADDLTVVRLRDGVGCPLICWYGLSGDLEEYRLLLAQPLGDRPVYGVVSPAVINAADLPVRLEEAVSAGLARLRQCGVDGPMALLGYSWGGLLAFEAARQLTAAGSPPVFTGLIGTQPPVIPRLPLERALHLLRWAPVSLWRRVRRPDGVPAWRSTLGRLRWLFGHRGFQPPPQPWPTPLHHAHVQMGFDYVPSPLVPVSVHLFRELATRDSVDHYGYLRYDLRDLGWGRWVCNPPIVEWFQGDHLSPINGAAVVELAELLKRHLGRLDRERTSVEPC